MLQSCVELALSAIINLTFKIVFAGFGFLKANRSDFLKALV